MNPLGEREPSTMHLSLVDVDGAMADPDAEVLTVRCSCSNFDLPSRLSFWSGDGRLHGGRFSGGEADYGAAAAIRSRYDPPTAKGQLWRWCRSFR